MVRTRTTATRWNSARSIGSRRNSTPGASLRRSARTARPARSIPPPTRSRSIPVTPCIFSPAMWKAPRRGSPRRVATASRYGRTARSCATSVRASRTVSPGFTTMSRSASSTRSARLFHMTHARRPRPKRLYLSSISSPTATTPLTQASPPAAERAPKAI